MFEFDREELGLIHSAVDFQIQEMTDGMPEDEWEFSKDFQDLRKLHDKVARLLQ